MSLAPDWMRRSRVFVRTDKRNPEGVDITDSLGGGGGSPPVPCPTCFALVTDAGQLTLHLNWHSTVSLTSHAHAALYAPIAHTVTNHPHGTVPAE